MVYAPSWSSDGTRMMFNDVLTGSTTQSNFVADMELPAVSVLVNGEKMEAQGLGVPDWFPDGEWFVFAVGFADAGRGNQLWLMPIDTSYAQVLADEENFYYYNYRWDPSRRKIVIQRLDLANPNALPEIVVWSLRTFSTEIVAEGGVDPGWAP